METDSELGRQFSTPPTSDLQKAWHIFALLLSIGRPAKATELTSRCTLYYATPYLIEHICGIPNSPIYLTPDGFVSISYIGYKYAKEMAENSVATLNVEAPYEFDIVLGQRVDAEAVNNYFRKWGKMTPDEGCLPAEIDSELALQLSTGDVTSDLQKAWHIFALLLSIGRPVRSTELAFKCTLFYTTPYLVEHFCRFPKSPICLTPDGFVTISSNGYIIAREIAENLNAKLKGATPNGFEIELGQRIDEEAVRTYFRKKRKMSSDNEYLPLVKKREIVNFEGENENAPLLALPCSIGVPSGKVYLPDGNISGGMELQSYDSEILAVDNWQKEKAKFGTSLLNNSTCGHFSGGLGNDESDNGTKVSKAVWRREINFNIFQSPAISTMAKMDDDNTSTRNINLLAAAVMEVDQQMNACQTEAQTATHAYGTTSKDLKKTERKEEERVLNSCCSRGDTGNQPIDTAEIDKISRGKPGENSVEACNTKVSFVKKGKSSTPQCSQETLMENSVYLCNWPSKSSQKSKHDQKNTPSQRLQSMGKALENGNINHPPQVSKRDKKSIISKKNFQHNHYRVMNAKEKKESCNINGKSSSIVAFDQLDQKVLPDFEAFVAEEQEGSGGYGTVYKAIRKSDGVTFAIKCPHANANRNHVHNELKMLERFGGKNFVIKYEGSFKSGNSDCLVLEHVVHDRPEVLKRDIDVQELQWYGYCMFRALAGLHKQGVVHRDVKPGNFLFNRKACKGYLIDFNLAVDLTQKHCATMDKAKAVQDVSFNHVPLPNGRSLPSAKNRKFVTAKALEVTNQERGKVSKSFLPSKKMKNESERANTCNEVGSRNITKSQGADGSGITSAKDPTSNRTPSGEKFREPLPCQGRKELISLVHEALQTANHKEVSIPVSKRKRIAAPPRQTDCKFIYLTPMPLHSAGVAVGGAGLLKSKGDGKHNREGPCVGTKGFRAPEVLVRSQHQGLKVDIWSAGVTLLYLMVGRTPFAGEPDQNIKEIAKLRGSEDLWEVAKLHNRESSIPPDLLDIKSLRSLKLQDWCKQNTRRPEFFDLIPRSLFDLVDKCLTVNPRLRISSEEALRHEFFSPCYEALRKQRLLRQQGVSLDFDSNLILQGQLQSLAEVS